MHPTTNAVRKNSVQAGRIQLTAANLRKHSLASIKNDIASEVAFDDIAWVKSADMYDDLQSYDDLEGSEEGDIEAKRKNVALRRAASLQALNAYGGCFASGFLAMQEPLPYTMRKWSNSSMDSQESVDFERLATDLASVTNAHMKPKVGSSRLRNQMTCTDCPRPDSDTLSNTDKQEIKPARRWRWKSFSKTRRDSAH